MDAAARSNKGAFPDDDDDDDEEEDDFGKEAQSSHKESMGKMGGGGNKTNKNNSEKKPSTPRSKHSATEQRRRSRINDRFRILRDLMPHSDQKRDKASFLLEVIEYIQCLQEKVQKFELLYPGWSPDNAKLMPWKTSHPQGESILEPPHVKTNPASTGFMFPADGSIPGVPAVMSNTQNIEESENLSPGLANRSASMSIPMQYPPVGIDSGFSQPQQRLVPESGTMTAQPSAQWPGACATDSSVSSDILSGQEELVIDEGTISLSSMYSDRLLTTLTQALQSSGIDLSQANVSVQINLGRRTTSRPMTFPMDQDDPSSSNTVLGHSRVRNTGNESEDANKRPKTGTG